LATSTDLVPGGNAKPTQARPSSLTALGERNTLAYRLWRARESFDASMRRHLSADELTNRGLWVNLDDFLNDAQVRSDAETARETLARFLFGDFARIVLDEVRTDLSNRFSTSTEQELHFLASFQTLLQSTASNITKSNDRSIVSGIKRNAGFFSLLLMVRIYGELYDLGAYMIYSFTEEVNNIHIIGTRMHCYRSNGQTWFALIPASSSASDMIALTSHYARSVDKRFDRGFTANNLDTSRQYRAAVRQKTPQFDAFIGVIRFHQHITPDQRGMVDYGYITFEAFNFINRCVAAAMPGLITGAPGSGKTTFLRAMTLAIPRTDPLLTVEYAPELFLDLLRDANDLPWFTTLHTHIVQGSSAEGTGAVPFDEIFKWGLQEDVVRFIVGEIADSASMITFINALQTGQSGALATLHANSVQDTVVRVTSLLSEVYPRAIAWQYLGQNLRFIVHSMKMRTATRERRFVTGIGWVDVNSTLTYDQPPIVHSVFERDLNADALVRGPGFAEGMRQLMEAERRAFGHDFGADLPTDALIEF